MGNPLPSDALQGRLEGAIRALENLGSPGRIAEHLATLGIRGRRCDARECPVANYCKLIIGEKGAAVSVGPSYFFTYKPTDLQFDVARGKTPDMVREFVTRFDDFQYPSLVDRADDGY